MTFPSLKNWLTRVSVPLLTKPPSFRQVLGKVVLHSEVCIDGDDFRAHGGRFLGTPRKTGSAAGVSRAYQRHRGDPLGPLLALGVIGRRIFRRHCRETARAPALLWVSCGGCTRLPIGHAGQPIVNRAFHAGYCPIPGHGSNVACLVSRSCPPPIGELVVVTTSANI
jgi:hypothetical protein